MEKKIILLLNPSEEVLLIKKKEIESQWKCKFLSITDVSQSSFYRGKSLFEVSEREFYCLLLKDKKSVKMLENYLASNQLPEGILILSTETQPALKKVIESVKQSGGTILKESSTILDAFSLSETTKDYLSKMEPSFLEKIATNLMALSTEEVSLLTVEEVETWLLPQEKIVPMWDIVDKILLGEFELGLSNWDKNKEAIPIYLLLSYLKRTVMGLYKVKTLGLFHQDSKVIMGKKEWFYKKCKLSINQIEEILLGVLFLENNIKGGSPIDSIYQISEALGKITLLVKKES